MQLNLRALVSISALFLVLVVGCSDAVAPHEVSQRPESSTHLGATHALQQSAQAEGGRGIEDDFLAMSRDVPEIGGFFRDGDGNLVVKVASPEAVEHARTAMERLRDSRQDLARNFLGTQAEVRVELARYSFVDLALWKERMRQSPEWGHGAIVLDADEHANRLRIGVVDDAAAQRVRADARTYGIPVEALEVEIMSARPTLSTSVRHTRRPSVAGIQIRRTLNPDILCTAGYQVRNPSNQVFALTASHCTSNFSGGAIGQAWNQATTSPWATIAVNPSWSTTGCATGAIRCTNADVAALQYNPGVSGTYGMVQTSSVGGNFTPGNLTIGTTIQAALPGAAMVGDTAYKTGLATGSTKGVVIATCSDVVFDDGYEVRCLTTARYWAEGGDSGAPVYDRWRFPYMVGVQRPFGIHTGSYYPTNWVEYPLGYFNPWARIEAHLGMGELLPYAP